MALTIAQALKLLAKGQAGDTRALATVMRELFEGASDDDLLALLGYAMPGNTRVLYDNNGAVAGDPNLIWNAVGVYMANAGWLDLAGPVASHTPAANYASFGRDNTAGVTWPATRQPDGFRSIIQPMIGNMWRKAFLQPFISGGTVTVASIGGAATPSGTLTAPALASTSIKTRNIRILCTSAAPAASLTGVTLPGTGFMRSTTAGAGGFRFEALFALNTDQTGFRLCCGVSQIPLAALIDPSSLLDIICVGYDAADNAAGNLIIIHNDGAGAGTRVDSGIARNTSSLYRIIFECVPGGGTIYWHLTNLVTGTSASGSLTTNLPTTEVPMAPRMEMTNAAIASACAFEFYQMNCDGPIS